jgi:hypothetical protein
MAPGLAFMALCLLVAGCASPNVDPAHAKPHTGYLDLYADSSSLCWEVDQLNDKDSNGKVIYQEFGFRPERILRLAFKPGQYHLQISFLNKVIAEPADVGVTVQDGMITPVQVTLDQTGKILVETRSSGTQGTYYGRFGRARRLHDNEAGMYHVSAEPQSPVPYRPKAQMPFANFPSK